MADTPDTFTDLVALAAPGNGLLIRTGQKWSYPGAQRHGTNLRIPSPNADGSRVQAALDAGAWVPWRFDAAGQPDMVCAADSPHLPRGGALKPADVGGVRSIVA